MYTLLTGLACAGFVACDAHETADTAAALSQNENIEMNAGKNNSNNVILEGTLGTKPDRSPLKQILVHGSTAPEGSDGFEQIETQVSFEKDASGSSKEKILSPEKL